MSFTHQFNLYTDPVNRDTDRQYLILHLFNGTDTPIMIQYRGTVTGLFTVHLNAELFKGVMITNSSVTTELNTVVSNCTLILSNGNLYSCTLYNNNDVLLSCQFPITIGDTSKLFSSIIDTFTPLHLLIDTNDCTGKIVDSLQKQLVRDDTKLEYKELTLDEEEELSDNEELSENAELSENVVELSELSDDY